MSSLLHMVLIKSPAKAPPLIARVLIRPSGYLFGFKYVLLIVPSYISLQEESDTHLRALPDGSAYDDEEAAEVASKNSAFFATPEVERWETKFRELGS